ncbi:MAG TPA: glycosyltransferase [Flavobacterium sp.]|jgi:cellulose synthase/poly-beta-1,6-N-acetylglucosamine synthase-like glycosyltransferase
MEVILLLLLLYVLIYVGYITALCYGFTKIKTFNSVPTVPETGFSIIIPFRTEEQNLPRLLESLTKLNYPLDMFELIFVDDLSEDLSVKLINRWRMENGRYQTTVLENLRLTGSPKKDAINRAVPIVAFDWIVTTDADCSLPENWLQTLNSYIQTNDVEMLAAAVAYEGKTSLLHHFERMDILSLQGATIGSFGLGKAFMCNGANFAYTKKLFYDLGGFSNNDKLASGDDVFLLQKAVNRSPDKVHYLKSADGIVKTNFAQSWKQLLNQRIRWASKTTSYENTFAEDLAIIVFFANLSLVIGTSLATLSVVEWEFVLLIFVIKSIPDFILLAQANKFLYKGKFFFPLFSAVWYPFFCVVVALWSLLGKYEWKGRKY